MRPTVMGLACLSFLVTGRRKLLPNDLEQADSHLEEHDVKRFARLLLDLHSPAAGWHGLRPAAHRTDFLPSLTMSVPSVARTLDQQDYTITWTKPSFFDRESTNRGMFRHELLRNDESRTPLYNEAIRKRLDEAGAGVLTVLDLGTGPFALFALEAARAGAKRVYAIEADATNAQLAREAVAAAGFESVVEVIEGFSTRVTLPEKVDVLISEIVGSIASEEGLYATIADAHQRHVKNPSDPRSWIPHRCQTLGAPASYALQIGLGHPAFEWLDKSHLYQRRPVAKRAECNDETLELLASAVVMEDVRFTDPETLLGAGSHDLMDGPGIFHIDESKLSANEEKLRRVLAEEGAASSDLDIVAPMVARGLSGIAMWPRLELDPEAKIVVEARGRDGNHQFSSWRTLVPFASKLPVPIISGSTVTARLHVELEKSISGTEHDQPQYTLNMSISNPTPAAGTGTEPGPGVREPSFGLLYQIADPLRQLHMRSMF